MKNVRVKIKTSMTSTTGAGGGRARASGPGAGDRGGGGGGEGPSQLKGSTCKRAVSVLLQTSRFEANLPDAPAGAPGAPPEASVQSGPGRRSPVKAENARLPNEGRVRQEFGTKTCTQLSAKQVNNRDLLQSAGNSVQHYVITCHGKAPEKVSIYMPESLCRTRKLTRHCKYSTTLQKKKEERWKTAVDNNNSSSLVKGKPTVHPPPEQQRPRGADFACTGQAPPSLPGRQGRAGDGQDLGRRPVARRPPSRRGSPVL